MYKGPFWLICRYEITASGDLCCDYTDSQLVVRLIPEDAEEMPSHRESWPLVCEGHSDHPWNYYPRGRVELRRGRALVFVNPLCLECWNLEGRLRSAFSISEEIPVIIKSDNSAHYACAGNDRSLL